jgi:hypothetical protein
MIELCWGWHAGVKASHREFLTPDGTTRRVKAGFDALGENNTDDCHSHGTHVAAIIGGKRWHAAVLLPQASVGTHLAL